MAMVSDSITVVSISRSHPAWGSLYRGGTRGFTEPSVAELSVIPVTANYTQALNRVGIDVVGPIGSGNIICVAEQNTYLKIRLILNGSSNGTVIIGRTNRLVGQVSFEGDGHLLMFSGSEGHTKLNATFRNHQAAMFFGRGFTANDVDCLAEGPHRSIQFGDDCMISYQVAVRTSDSHGIVDIESPAQAINPPESVTVMPHAWLAARTTIMKGLAVGSGAIVAAGAIVTSDVPPLCLVAGIPAKILRRNVTWTRESQPNPQQIASAVRRVTEIDGIGTILPRQIDTG